MKKQDKPKADAKAVEKPEPKSSAENRTERLVPEHRRCPLCWGRDKGKGVAYNTKKESAIRSIRYYRCDCCGHTWSQKVIKEVFPIEHCKIDVEHHTVEVEHRER